MAAQKRKRTGPHACVCAQVYRWNTRDLLCKTPLLSTGVKDGHIEQSMVTAIVAHLEPSVEGVD